MNVMTRNHTNHTLRSTLLFAALIGLPTVLYVGALLFDPGRSLVLWERNPLDMARVWPLALGLSVYALLSLWIIQHFPIQPRRRQVVGLLAFAFVSGCVLQVAAAYPLEPYPLRGILFRELSSLSGGYWTVGARVQDVHTFLADYARTMASYPVHPQRHPPGLPLLFWGLTQVAVGLPGLSASVAPWVRPMACFDAQAAWLNDAQITAGLLGTLLESVLAFITIVPLYALVRRLADARTATRAAAIAVLFYILMPGMLAWASQFDRTFALIAITGLWLTEKLVSDSRRAGWVALALGLLLSLGTFLSFGNAPIILMCALYAALRVWQRERLSAWRTRAGQAALVLLGLLSIWVFCAVFFQLDPIGIYRTGMSIHYELVRPYWPFVVWHAWDILTFIGLPLAGIALFLLWKRAPALSLALAGTLALLCLLHVARGETGRVWMFFAPLVAASAALYLGAHNPARRTAVATLLVLQAVVQIGVLRMITYGTDPLGVADAALPVNLIATDIRYGRQGEMQLLGYTVGASQAGGVRAGDSPPVTLYWKLDSTAPISSSYRIFIHVAESLDDTAQVGNSDSPPQNWALPTSCWRPGQVVSDPHDIPIAADARPGSYLLLVGLYDHTLQREYVQQAQRAKNNAVELPGTLTVTAGDAP
jgi:hypothetical protein